MSFREEMTTSRPHVKETFMADLRKACELFSGDELLKVLQKMRKSLDDPNCITDDNVFSMLISFRDIQDYNAMITLVDEINANTALKFSCTPRINHLYAFALNRRNQNRDREIAESVIKSVLEDEENHNPHILCMYGRIYKDKFVESNHTDMENLDNAIHWYRKGFEIQPNEYAAINLATLLVAKGNDFFTCPEIQKIASLVNGKLMEIGTPETMKNYWDVATLFEICVLSKNYARAIVAADCMFRLKPANWCLKSTLQNIAIINYSKPILEEVQSPEVVIFNFWMDFFTRATEKIEGTFSRLPVLVLTPSDVYMPSYIELKVEPKTCSISSLCIEELRGKCTDTHKHVYNANCIKSVSVDEYNKCLLLLHLHNNSQTLTVVFSSAHDHKVFYLQIQEIFPDVIPIKKT